MNDDFTKDDIEWLEARSFRKWKNTSEPDVEYYGRCFSDGKENKAFEVRKADGRYLLHMEFYDGSLNFWESSRGASMREAFTALLEKLLRRKEAVEKMKDAAADLMPGSIAPRETAVKKENPCLFRDEAEKELKKCLDGK